MKPTVEINPFPGSRAGRTGASHRVLRRGALALALTLSAIRLCAEVQIERIYMPLDAGPSSFAIGLPGGVNFCFDPVRGGVSYVWTGGFLDLSPARPGPGKFIAPVKLLGPVVYQETGSAPLRRGDPARTPTVEFSGYTLFNDGVEFRYTVDGVAVRDLIRARSDGTGLVRRMTVTGAGDSKWWHVVEGRPPLELKRESNDVRVLEIEFPRRNP